jgi:cell wall-associated protease
MQYYLRPFAFLAISILIAGCGSAVTIPTTPIQISGNSPQKVQELSREELKTWWHLDLKKDTVPGMSVQRTYDEIIRNRKGQTVIVGVIDSGIDIEHEDLRNVIWTNPGEIAGNGIDDDGNGYIDDIHGWNFLGDIVGEQMEYVRIMLRLAPKFEDKPESAISTADREEYALYQKAKAEYLKEKQEALGTKVQYESMIEVIRPAHERVAQKLGKEDYTRGDLKTLQDDISFGREVFLLDQMFEFDDNIPNIIKEIDGGVKYFSSRLDYHFNVTRDFRATLGDDPYDITDVPIGNNQVSGPDPEKEDAKHGTHVSGIIAAQRNNGIGLDGVAQNVQIMALRAVPDGDEYDKDIALAIRYAVDNGAKVINTSFGKMYSPNPEWVYEAIKYASDNDVLIVNAAGNDGFDLDDEALTVFPNDQRAVDPGLSNTFLTVGALNYTYDENLIASFSNYGKTQVDVFAPGVQIWSSTPNDEYEFQMGTSMAAPAVAGVAAMLRSYYPQLTAAQVKQIIMDSGLPSNQMVILGGEEDNKRPFSEISTSGKMVNMYNAFIMAEMLTNPQ